jgi:hypothetical protein
VNAHLKVLVAEDKPTKTKRGTYLPTEIFDDMVFDGWSYFEDYLNTKHFYIVHNRNILDLQGLGNIILNLLKNGSNRPEASLEKYIFEFANRIGAYLVYIFIESFRSHRNDKSDDVRSVLTEHFLKEALPLMDLLADFLLSLPINATEKGYYKLNEGAFKKISQVYENLYPNMTKSIEGGYRTVCDVLFPRNDEIKENNNCSHKWKKKYVHKIGDRYLCRKCDTIVASPKDSGIGGGSANA